ncbi:hypothetical protein ACN24L_00180 [Streptomyces microflavus]
MQGSGGQAARLVENLKRQVALLQEQGRGAERGRLGALVLYEHVVVASLGGRELPHAGLHARFDRGGRVHSLYLTKPDCSAGTGRSSLTAETPAAGPEEGVRLFDEEEVRDLEMKIFRTATIG